MSELVAAAISRHTLAGIDHDGELCACGTRGDHLEHLGTVALSYWGQRPRLRIVTTPAGFRDGPTNRVDELVERGLTNDRIVTLLGVSRQLINERRRTIALLDSLAS